MHDNFFGMFIHWGLYAETGFHEQAFARLNMERETYEGLAKRFCPQAYHPEEWVLLAQEAGMKYICFTAKHHDGFCLWDTAETDFSVMHTPYGKDVLKELSDACRKYGMKLSLYYSCPDWHQPDAYNRLSSHQWKAETDNPDIPEYVALVKAQIKELLTGYGEIYSFFWDIPPHIEDPSVNELVRTLQPGILINDRGFSQGDFSTPERELTKSAPGNRFLQRTEACNSVGEQSWGYRSSEDFYSLRTLTHSIDRYMAMGGSYLLNIGPKADGSIAPAYRDMIRKVGEWYRKTEGCLENHQKDPFPYELPDGVIAARKNGKTYFHFPDGLTSSAFSLRTFPGCPRLPRSVRLLNRNEELPFAYEPLPFGFHFDEPQKGCDSFLHIRGIPVDELESEAVVLEVVWADGVTA
ncbi:MAG: alpha-L-fucosidase [Clostridia bacterium]|nr:alpha-L-fucosidase [Clostridia bacterium]